jgi:sugar (pentulose or hexulose) kinase
MGMCGWHRRMLREWIDITSELHERTGAATLYHVAALKLPCFRNTRKVFAMFDYSVIRLANSYILDIYEAPTESMCEARYTTATSQIQELWEHGLIGDDWFISLVRRANTALKDWKVLLPDDLTGPAHGGPEHAAGPE